MTTSSTFTEDTNCTNCSEIEYAIDIVSPYHQTNLKIIAAFGTVVCAFGVLGNVVCAVVLHKIMEKNKGVRLLKHLALVDIMVLLAVFVVSFGRVLDLALEDDGVHVSNMYDALFFFKLIAYTFEIYLTIIIAMQRCLAVAMPLKYEVFSKKTIVDVVLVIAAVLAVLINVFGLFRHIRLCRETHKSMTLVFRCIVPMTILSVCNAILVIKGRASYTQTDQSTTRDGANRLTGIIVAITTVSFVTHVPSAMNMLFLTPTLHTLYLNFVVHLFIVINSSINFVLYCLFCKEFQRRLTGMIRKRRNSQPSVSRT